MQAWKESSANNLAGTPGFEPGKAVLETAVIPFHHVPKFGRIGDRCPTIERQA